MHGRGKIGQVQKPVSIKKGAAVCAGLMTVFMLSGCGSKPEETYEQIDSEWDEQQWDWVLSADNEAEVPEKTEGLDEREKDPGETEGMDEREKAPDKAEGMDGREADAVRKADSYAEAYDMIEQGDWSVVVPFDGMEELKKHYLWRRVDLNSDGMRELICMEDYGPYYHGEEHQIEYIFTYWNGRVELVLDLDEYEEQNHAGLFLGENGNLIRVYGDSAPVREIHFSKCHFDRDWNFDWEDEISAYFFYEDDYYDDVEKEVYQKNFPDTYGAYGGGLYCCYEYRQEEENPPVAKSLEMETVRENITAEGFLDLYKEMTGRDFLPAFDEWIDDFEEEIGEVDAERAYQEFLDGYRKVHIDMDGEKYYHAFGTRKPDSDMLLRDILQRSSSMYDVHDEEWQWLRTVRYAYLDCGADGKRELAIQYRDSETIDDMRTTFIVVYEDGELYLRHAYESWSRYNVYLSYYGYLDAYGSGGAYNSSHSEAVLDKNGREQFLYELYYDGARTDHVEEDLGEHIFGEKPAMFCHMVYSIGEDVYTRLEPNEDVDERKWRQFYELYEEKNGRLYTGEEIQGLIGQRKGELGIRDIQLSEDEPEWMMLENPIYQDLVREIALSESRRRRREEGGSILSDLWIACGPKLPGNKVWETAGDGIGGDAVISLAYTDFSLGISFRSMIRDVLSDYCNRSGIPEAEWTIVKAVSFGEGLYAVTVQRPCIEETGQKKREICFLINSEAMDLGMEEYTEYIVAVDFRYDSEGDLRYGVSDKMSYNTMLDWTSYMEQASWNAENPYTLSCNGEVMFDDSFLLYSVRPALNKYLRTQREDTTKEWVMDINEVCPVGDGRLVICRFVCEDKEIVMALDGMNKYSAVVRGLGE